MASNHSHDSLKTVNGLNDISARQRLRPAPLKPPSVGGSQRRWKLQLEKVHMWTCAVVVGQFFVLAIGLVFFGLDNFTHTPMSQELARRGRSSPRAMSYVVTAVSTAVSALSTL
ncbi:hypothetical protein CROQUDRAFT_535120 [Cronartium quercuum f. sp. fusiforme G11]|uniref:Uncharacterized protein n=1 Tax=Cronartium quercuum f. sp. fusiforme G11 TaxID=708437 RepID=A0A9P6TBU6_9BASI|nr:hypothetical protein CROQUDRAFT_535120 [Cronartium quercuum f. sp. fusiforme G11]